MTTSGVKERQPVDKPEKSAARKRSNARKANLGKLDVKKVRLGLAVLLVAVGIVIGAIALLGGDSDDSSASSGAQTNAVALSLPELLAQTSSLAEPAYWVGPRAGTDSYELTTTLDGRVYIRYLTEGAGAGDPRPSFLTVGSYPVDEARQALRDATATAKGNQTLTQHDGFEVLSSEEATNAYVVFDNQPRIQIEVYSPEPGEAAELATSGALEPVG